MKTKVNNNIKLKSGGGLENDPTNGLGLKAGDALPAMNGGLLTNTSLLKTGLATRLGSAGTGDLVITHNLGYVPKLIKIDAVGVGKAANVAESIQRGVYDGTNNYYVGARHTSGTTLQSGTGNIFRMLDNSTTVYCAASITAISDTTFTVNFSVNDVNYWDYTTFIWEVYK